ncbi:MAG: hypothetical protein KKA79_05535 [Nanoarchaeota archaeon]|nr:hypothetical protein [Nanoarchaeota archaeon]MCG2717475.1 hypothetical protein [Nanoarchaeota archaeon]
MSNISKEQFKTFNSDMNLIFETKPIYLLRTLFFIVGNPLSTRHATSMWVGFYKDKVIFVVDGKGGDCA